MIRFLVYASTSLISKARITAVVHWQVGKAWSQLPFCWQVNCALPDNTSDELRHATCTVVLTATPSAAAAAAGDEDDDDDGDDVTISSEDGDSSSSHDFTPFSTRNDDDNNNSMNSQTFCFNVFRCSVSVVWRKSAKPERRASESWTFRKWNSLTAISHTIQRLLGNIEWIAGANNEH